jgi:hypothetical protein
MMNSAAAFISAAKTVPDMSTLLQSSLRGLAWMKNPQDESFYHRIVKHADSLYREGSSLRYSIMTLLGLTAAERVGLQTNFDTRSMFCQYASAFGDLDDLGDLALLVWLFAEREPGRLEPFLRDPALRPRIESLDAFRSSRTMELSWLLAALSHVHMSNAAGASRLSDLAHTVFRLLIRNQGPQGLFGHFGPTASPAGSLRSRLGSFADQIYPIYALAQYAQAWDCTGALSSATKCADTLCSLQGPLGQWWWHYDSLRGRVVSHYPVYSVHQDGMAPMALLALSRISGKPFHHSVYRGLSWIYGDNELATDLRDPETGLIWRCLHQNSLTRYSSELLGVFGMPPRNTALHVLYECRPYHLGWLLYAFCPQVDLGNFAS